MRWWPILGLAVALAAPMARADEVYRSVDASGRPVYSNLPSDNAVRSGGVVESATATGGGPAATGGAGLAPSALVRRGKLERDLRETERRLRALDEQLATLARLRTRNAAGSAATGGVRAAASDVVSDEERALASERDRLRQHADELRDASAKLGER